MDRVAEVVGKDLHRDMVWPQYSLCEIDHRILEQGFDSRLAASIASGSTLASLTRGIPRPPSATVLTNNGNRMPIYPDSRADTSASTKADGADK